MKFTEKETEKQFVFHLYNKIDKDEAKIIPSDMFKEYWEKGLVINSTILLYSFITSLTEWNHLKVGPFDLTTWDIII